MRHSERVDLENDPVRVPTVNYGFVESGLKLVSEIRRDQYSVLKGGAVER